MGSRKNCPNRKLTVKTAPKVGNPTLTEIAWAAGIYEGEGSVSSCRPTRPSMTVCVTQKDPWILIKFVDLFGGSYFWQKQANCHRWILSGPRGRGFAYTIFPFLSPRRQEQLKKALG